jgi:hypothetical protein
MSDASGHMTQFRFMYCDEPQVTALMQQNLHVLILTEPGVIHVPLACDNMGMTFLTATWLQ